MDPVVLFIVTVLCGVVVGFISGLMGVGGGVLMIPLFRLGFGFAPMVCTGTSLFTIIFTSITGTVNRLRYKLCVPQLGLVIGLSGALTSPLGVWVSNHVPGVAVMIICALVIAYTGYSTIRKAMKLSEAEGGVQPDPDEFYHCTREELLRGAGIGLFAGFCSGFLGIGGGFLIIPLLVAINGLSLKLATGTSLTAIMIMAIVSSVENIMLGNVSFITTIAITIGAIPGSYLGTKVVRKVPEKSLRIIFGVFLLACSIVLTINEITLIL